MKEIEIEAEDGNVVTLQLFNASTFMPDHYLKIGKNGYLADFEGNLVNFDGVILTSRDDVAELINRIQQGEELTEELEQIKGI